MSKKKHSHGKLARDLLFVTLGVFAAVMIVKFGVLENIPVATQGARIVGSFIAGVFFTSLFTITLASFALVKIAHTTPVLTVAFWGALGAMIGDMVLFLFIRDSLADDIMDIIRNPHYRKIRSIFKLRIFRWLIPLFGAMIIISPLPDELGLAMMGFSKVSTIIMLPLTFALNFLGILLIISFAGGL